ncbi:phosphotransferase [Mycoplasma bradburyae]|uniref:Phosphotransferase n=1 Tax=Mycoplasma bradburyae TaxID=2963128 RepID=A0ABT5GCF1_9MOLU|nr:phosphotransferase [Mycoplasma bradburyae]MDC4182145.1 phosphotransferase [Mycoplasma bradburyae]UTS70286.1 phosphotransferase [Mycoplasma bradburyae]
MKPNQDVALEFFITHTDYLINDVVSIQEIHNGFTNISYLLKTKDNKQYQVRFAQNNELVSRINEYEVIKLLNNDLFIFFDKQTGDCIKKWIPGKEVDYFDKLRLDNLAKAIKQIHQVDISNSSILKINYLAGIDNAKLSTRHKKLYYHLINKYKNLPQTLTHSDLNAHNMLVDQNNQIHLIDFEWSRINTPYFDLANMARESLNLQQAYYLVESYQGLDKTIFNDFLIITCIFALIWTYNMAQTDKIIAYRKEVQKRLDLYLKLFIGNI